MDGGDEDAVVVLGLFLDVIDDHLSLRHVARPGVEVVKNYSSSKMLSIFQTILKISSQSIKWGTPGLPTNILTSLESLARKKTPANSVSAHVTEEKSFMTLAPADFDVPPGNYDAVHLKIKAKDFAD